MNMKIKNRYGDFMKLKKLFSIDKLIILFIITLIIASTYTFSRYATTHSRSGKTTVAKFKVGVDNIQSIDLFFTTDSNSVKPGKVAPGMTGSFKAELSNDSEVVCNYVLTLDEDSNIPILYSLDNTNFVNASEIRSTGQLDIEETKDIDIYWKWDINAVSNIDTLMGQDDNNDYKATVELNVEFDQVD